MAILKIFREEIESKKIEYNLTSKKNEMELYINGDRIIKIDRSYFEKAAKKIYEGILEGSGVFSIDGAEEIMNKLQCQKIKASSDDKTDIILEVHDACTSCEFVRGYSIKSDIGNPPTLLNAGKTTNFIYEVENISDENMMAINSIVGKSKIKNRLQYIDSIKFVRAANETFSANLLFIDTMMEIIISEMIKIHYFEGISDCSLIASKIEENNPLNYKIEGLYRYKIKKFLYAVALGLMPSKPWNGYDEANGGYIIVKENGEILAYYLYNRNNFETYLLNNTKLETAATGKHNFGVIYKNADRKYIDLNLQIRFKQT